MPWFALLPGAAFALIFGLERFAPQAGEPKHDRWDWALNLAGLAMQGAAVPLIGYWLTTQVLAPNLPQAAGALQIGFWGAFALNFVVIDLLYYWQHRAMHRGWAWRLHLTHHASQRVDVWATSRNTLWVNFLFVYFLVNPWAALLCDRPDGFYAAAAVTAALDLWCHGRIDYAKLRLASAMRALSFILITPAAHHRHHDATRANANFGANLSLWDRLFGTYEAPQEIGATAAADAPAPLRQLFWPLKTSAGERP